ncbi:hypothetical protein NIES4106_37590 [Fischerella sp. NIES-4106]|nr:hypothetical protein NIES4106_37590 [Fischerella sp. NIES-4106]
MHKETRFLAYGKPGFYILSDEYKKGVGPTGVTS